jgi:hypothetical protein
MPTTNTNYRWPTGTPLLFTGPWLAYHSIPGHPASTRYLECYTGTLLGWWNGFAEFSADRQVTRAIVTAFDALATFESGSWRTLAWDSDALLLHLPRSLGGGVHRITPLDGTYRIGWGMPWHEADPAACDRTAGHR